MEILFEAKQNPINFSGIVFVIITALSVYLAFTFRGGTFNPGSTTGHVNFILILVIPSFFIINKMLKSLRSRVLVLENGDFELTKKGKTSSFTLAAFVSAEFYHLHKDKETIMAKKGWIAYLRLALLWIYKESGEFTYIIRTKKRDFQGRILFVDLPEIKAMIKDLEEEVFEEIIEREFRDEDGNQTHWTLTKVIE